MFVPIQSKEGWRIRNNYKLQKLIKGGNIVQIIQTQRIKWWGHLNRMEDIKLEDYWFETCRNKNQRTTKE